MSASTPASPSKFYAYFNGREVCICCDECNECVLRSAPSWPLSVSHGTPPLTFGLARLRRHQCPELAA